VEEVILGPKGVIEGARGGSVVADMSTISPSATRAIADRLRTLNVEMLDAPVSGGDVGASKGTLSIMAGGSEAAFNRVKPLFQVMGTNVVHIGGNGAGQVCKSCNQILVGNTIAGVGEAMLLARASGVDPAKVRAALLGGFANSKVLEVHGQRMIDHDFEPGFKVRLHQKDMRIVLEAANELGLALPGAAVVAQYLNALMGQGLGEIDSSAIYRVQEAFCGADEAGKPSADSRAGSGPIS
jgi:2-hydroxy-3-oxopropionate reductase